MDRLEIDCDRCSLRGRGCDDCVVSVLLGIPEESAAWLNDDEARAVDALAAHGMVPPLRLLPVCFESETELKFSQPHFG